MGDYSYFVDEDLDISDIEGLKAFLAHWENLFPNNLTVKLTEFPIAKRLKRDCYTVSFEEGWNGIKLISYWYASQVVFLKCIAKYLEGYVRWTFGGGDGDQQAKVNFDGGDCNISLGGMKWENFEPPTISGLDRVYDKDSMDKNSEWNKLKEVMLLNKL